MDINFELYKIFYHVARLKSFSEAARELYISQSAVSQSVKSLEEKLGAQLLNRNSRSVSLTAEGELLYHYVEQACNFIQTAEEKLDEVKNLELGEIRIGAGDTICRYFLIPYLESFTKMHPRIKVQVINRTTSQILEKLKSGKIDIGIATLPVEDDSLTAERFMDVEDIFIASSRFAELKTYKLPLARLADYPLLLLDRGSSTRRNLDAFLSGKGIEVTPELELESIELLVEFARIGMGIAHVLKESAQDLIRKEELFEVVLEEKLPLRQLGIVTMKNMPLSPASRAFMDHLKKGNHA